MRATWAVFGVLNTFFYVCYWWPISLLVACICFAIAIFDKD